MKVRKKVAGLVLLRDNKFMENNGYIIKLTDIYKTYKMGDSEIKASDGINLEIKSGEFVVIMGPSGSGKSTIMNIIGCLDRPSSGSYILDGKEISKLNDDELAHIRNLKIGFIFQKFHLLPGSNALENVELPMIYSGIGSGERIKTATKSLVSVGLGDRLHHNPNELSGGQMQRVSIARSLVNKPPILLADEPTGNLDTKSGAEIMALFQELHRQGRTIVLITHNNEIAKYGTRIIKLQDGVITSDEQVKDCERIILEKENVDSVTGKFTGQGSMNILQSFKVAWKALKTNKMRSILTMLGIIIGVAAVIVMTSIGEGTKYHIITNINSLGSNLIYISQGRGNRSLIQSSIRSNENMLTMKDVDALKKKCSLIKNIAPQDTNIVIARYMTNNLSVSLIGTSPEFPEVRNFSIDKGRFFNEEEMKKRETVCILGSSIAKTLFGEHTNPIGKTIKVSRAGKLGAGTRFTVIGIFKEKDLTFGNDNRSIVTPLPTVNHRLFHYKYIDAIYIQASDTSVIKDAKNEIYRALLPLHNNKPENIEIGSQDEMIKSVEQTMGAFTFMLSGIALLSLLVGGIGIMNIMIISVTERTREIGLRKALGARKNDILFQFLVEALVLGITGGIIGICTGLVMAKVYTIITATSSLKMLSRTFISINSILLSFSFSALVGIFFGLYPAKKAASLDPIDALRYE